MDWLVSRMMRYAFISISIFISWICFCSHSHQIYAITSMFITFTMSILITLLLLLVCGVWIMEKILYCTLHQFNTAKYNINEKKTHLISAKFESINTHIVTHAVRAVFIIIITSLATNTTEKKFECTPNLNLSLSLAFPPHHLPPATCQSNRFNVYSLSTQH